MLVFAFFLLDSIHDSKAFCSIIVQLHSSWCVSLFVSICLCLCVCLGFCLFSMYLSLLAIVLESDSEVLLCSLSSKVTDVHQPVHSNLCTGFPFFCLFFYLFACLFVCLLMSFCCAYSKIYTTQAHLSPARYFPAHPGCQNGEYQNIQKGCKKWS